MTHRWTWTCARCSWSYPEHVRQEPAFIEGQTKAFCCLCLPINPARLSKEAARDFAVGQAQARQARLDGSAFPPEPIGG